MSNARRLAQRRLGERSTATTCRCADRGRQELREQPSRRPLEDNVMGVHRGRGDHRRMLASIRKFWPSSRFGRSERPQASQAGLAQGPSTRPRFVQRYVELLALPPRTPRRASGGSRGGPSASRARCGARYGESVSTEELGGHLARGVLEIGASEGTLPAMSRGSPARRTRRAVGRGEASGSRRAAGRRASGAARRFRPRGTRVENRDGCEQPARVRIKRDASVTRSVVAVVVEGPLPYRSRAGCARQARSLGASSRSQPPREGGGQIATTRRGPGKR